MLRTHYCGRRAAFIENEQIRVTVLEEGGHIAEILDKETNINRLWVPPWPSIEPGAWLPAKTRIDVEYCAVIGPTDLIPESLNWPT